MGSIPSPLAAGCYFHLLAMSMGAPWFVCLAMGLAAFALAPRAKR